MALLCMYPWLAYAFCILNLLLMEYVEDEFTDALIDAICGEDLSSPSI